MKELTDESVKSIGLKLAGGKSYLPRMRQLANACFDMTDKWGMWGGQSASYEEMLRKILGKILAARSFKKLTENELRHCPEIIFREFDGKPPIWSQKSGGASYLDDLIAEIRKRGSSRTLRHLVGWFFFVYPAVSGSTYAALRNAVKSDSFCSDLVGVGFFSGYDEAGAVAAKKMPEFSADASASFYEEFRFLSRGLISAAASFTQRIWEKRIPKYARAVSRIYRTDEGSLDRVLESIKKDACLPGSATLVRLAAIELFAETILDELIKTSPRFLRIPSEEEGQKIYLFIREIGRLTDQSEVMQRLKERFDALFENWRTGKTLFECVDFIDDYLEEFGNAADGGQLHSAHWRNRKAFWTDFWRKGGVKKSFVFLPKGAAWSLEQDSALRRKYPSFRFVRFMKNYTLSPKEKPFLVMVLEDHTVVEASFNGLVRIIPNYRAEKLLDRDLPDWDYVTAWAIHDIPHHQTVWRANVLAALGR